ncbi:MAG: hypothetical protein II438_02505 [Clostridiales bacterium]|nr:hypothetical protein [Clostridiales bacterium]MBQ5520049.1 hypothetical protein [Clostridiales bacterium]
MKRVLIATLSTVMALGMAGCATQEVITEATKAPESSVVLTEEQVDKQLGAGRDEVGDNLGATDIIASENPTDNKDAAASDAIPGTWQTASMSSNADGTLAPSRYIQFTSADIKYGQMKDGAFVEDYSDKITKLEKTAAGGFIVQAEAANGVKYTFKTSDTDVNTMEYYETWTESEYAEKYSASGSITKSNA